MRPDVADRDTGTTTRSPQSVSGCAHRRELRLLRRELHDNVGSVLSAVEMQLVALQRLVTSSPEEARRRIRELHGEVTSLVEVLRRLTTRSDERSVGPCGESARTLRTMLAKVRQVFGDRIRVVGEIDPVFDDCPEEVASVAFCIVREAITNVLKHSRARHCSVRVSVRDRVLHVRVRDDGVGLPRDAGAGGSGLFNMKERASEIGGRCSVRAARPRGVRVLALLPLTGLQEMGADGACHARDQE